MFEPDMRLVGEWRRHDVPPCASAYAAVLQIRPNGLYFGQSEPPDGFTWWDGGTWEIVAPGKIALATANDAVITYSYDLDNQELSFTDSSGCRFSYRRSQ